jgi:hypothetical protein
VVVGAYWAEGVEEVCVALVVHHNLQMKVEVHHNLQMKVEVHHNLQMKVEVHHNLQMKVAVHHNFQMRAKVPSLVGVGHHTGQTEVPGVAFADSLEEAGGAVVGACWAINQT